MKILVMSRKEIEDKIKSISEKTAIISIKSFFDDTAPKVHYTDFVTDILFLSFDDLECSDKYKTYMTDEDAQKIKLFIEKVKDKVEQIIVHCDAGVSRSAGVAAAIGKYLIDDDMFIFGRPRYAPNMTCYRKTLDALMGIEIDKSLFDFNMKIASLAFDVTTEKEFEELIFRSEEEFQKWIELKREQGFVF